nr:hypothetical protein Iba_chr03aCG17520 [Ipomoea batatas]
MADTPSAAALPARFSGHPARISPSRISPPARPRTPETAPPCTATTAAPRDSNSPGNRLFRCSPRTEIPGLCDSLSFLRRRLVASYGNPCSTPLPSIAWREEQTYEDIGGGIVISGAGGGEADTFSKIRNLIRRIKVGRDERAEAKTLGNQVGRNPAVAEPPGGAFSDEVAAVGLEVALEERGDLVVVAGIHGGVAEHNDCREFRSGGRGNNKSE